MKYIYMLFFAGICFGCAPNNFTPQHFGIAPSCELEIQEGTNVKYKPKLQTNLDWNF
jgi:hypothetical protein